jgi:adenylate cyclase
MAREHRRLAAILFADVVGSSRLMGRDESGTVARLLEHLHRRLAPAAARCGGRVIRLTGDGGLVEFGSAVDALRAAIEFQQAVSVANRSQPETAAIVFRIGLNLGDVIFEGGDIYGDDVNVAARLEAEAPPGGIVVSRAVREAVSGRLKVSLHALGDLALKNIERPIRAFRVEWAAADWPAIPVVSATSTAPLLALPDKPSIAVLPFANLSDDAGQGYLADGFTDEIITALSHFRSLFVIARDSVFAYRDRQVDIQTIGRELGVRYVLAGSMRRAGDRIRVSAHLVQADTGVHMWAQRYDGKITDIFDLQDQVASDVVGAIAPKLERAEIERAVRKPTTNADAYDIYLRGMAKFYLWTMKGADEARPLFHRAIELDPGFAAAHAMAAHLCSHAKAWGVAIDRAKMAETAALARRAVDLSPDDAFVLCLAGWALSYPVLDLSSGAELVERAVLFNPNLAAARFISGFVNVWLGKHEVAIAHLAHAMRLSPSDPANGPSMIAMAHAHFMAERCDEAFSWAIRAVNVHPVPSALRIAAASAAAGGRLSEAKSFIEQMRQVDPTRRLSNVEETLGPYRRREDIERYKEALRLAGLAG